MEDGEAGFEALAEDPVGLYADIWPQKIKVDATPPHNIKIGGLQNGNELPMGEAHLKVEATDGEGTTKSSGIKSIKVSVDGYEVAGSAASCPEGPCTASTEFTLVARDYTSGQHTMIVTATDNADNVAQEEFKFRVGGASPVSVGPGSVDPSDGQLTLNATDVSLGDTGGVSRTYQSRELTAGAEGPLGPQWAISLGGGEGLNVLPEGSAVVTASNGTSTLFKRNGKGEFESPKGDSNLELEAKEKEPGKGVSEYVLTDVEAGSKTTFEQPAGAQSITPTFINGFGSETGQLKHPISDAIDPTGDVWVVSNADDLLEKFSPTGVLLGTYGSEGTAGGELTDPLGVAVDPRNGDVYVSDQGLNRIDEFSSAGAFIKMFGWGVSNGNAEFEICTEKCQAGIAGSGNGQMSDVAGLSVDSSGNVWLADFGNNRIQEFNEKGEYERKFGTAGKGAEQFEGPTDIALSGGNLYITDSRSNDVQEFSTAGTYLGKFGEEGSGNGQFLHPYGIASDPRTGNLYVVDTGHPRVEEFTAAGSFVEKFGASGSGVGELTLPQGVAVNSSGNVYVVDYGANSVDEWTRPKWVPIEAGGPLAASATTYAYATVEEDGKAEIEPTEALAPIPTGVSSCTPLVQGCRALTFKYATETTAAGENESEWGEYKGHLSQVVFHAYNPSTKAMEEKAVAQYSYDKQGRLRAEWDPRLEHPLKIVYGYDAEGHVTALTPPGQESWAFTYGTISGDSNTGRLLRVTRAPASAKLWEGEVLSDSEAPKLSGTPAVGVRMSVSNGSWSNEPVAYAYQWEDCDTGGESCTPILGATNANYTPASSDVGRTLLAEVTATNGGGSIATVSTASGEVKAAELTEYSLPSDSLPYKIVAGPDENLWFTEIGTSKVAKMTTSGAVTEYTQPSGSVPDGITSGPDGDLWFTDFETNKIAKMTTSGSATEYSVPSGSEPYNITSGPDGNLWFTDLGSSKIGKITTSGAVTEYSLPSGSMPAGITGGPDGDLWFTDYGTNKVAKITTSGTVTEYTQPSGSKPYNIISGPDGNLWFTDLGSSKIGKITTSGVITEYILPSGSEPSGIVVGADGNLWFTDYASSRIGRITTSGTITEYGVPAGSRPYRITPGPNGNLWFTEEGTSKIGQFNPNPTRGEAMSSQPGSTIEYGVPVSGEGAPHNMSKEAVAEWGQKDDPVEGTAIFPPDEPQGWPASDYKRATVHYWDTHGRTVNTAIPSGAIATNEYNEANETTRTLSADNRVAALKEGCESVPTKCKSAEVSEKLDTKTEYNAEDTNVLKVVGPEHKVKLSTGEEVEARALTHDYYDEGAKEAEEKNDEEYNLLTKTTSGALLSGGEEKDVRTTTTSYSGQEDLGWKLRKPTSTTIDPGGQNLTNTTVYDPATGNVIEAQTPGGSSEHYDSSPYSYSSQFGYEGTENGQFKKPRGIAISPEGDIWVADATNSRVQEFNEKGEYLSQFGSKGSESGQFKTPRGIAVDSKGDIWVADTGNSRVEEFNEKGEYLKEFGSKGAGEGQLRDPYAIAVDSKGNVWVADTYNSRVEEFTEKGEYIKSVGSEGSGNGQFYEPEGIAVDSAGDVWVADTYNNRLEEFNEKGEYIKTVGSEGSGNGQFSDPVGVAVDSKGDVWVADASNSRVEEFNEKGEYLSKFGSNGAGPGQLKEPSDVAVDSKGNVWVADTDNNCMEEWSPAVPPVYDSAFGSSGSGNGQLKESSGDAVDAQGDVWVADSGNNRVEEFSPNGEYSSQFGTTGTGNGQLKHPEGIAVARNGDLWVADTENSRLEEFSPKGEYITQFASKAGQPSAVAIAPNGDLWVTVWGYNRLDEYTPSGEDILHLSTQGGPSGVAVNGSGDVWVTDVDSDVVQEFSGTGEQIREIGSAEGGGASGEIVLPSGISTDAAGNVWITEGWIDRVQEFSSTGEYITQFGSWGSGAGQLNYPTGIAVVAGLAYIVDGGNNRVEKWNPLSTTIGNPKVHDTQTIYYTSKSEAGVSACQNHPEWANLPCQTRPTTQPADGLPELPVTTMTYNMWDEIEATTEKFGSTKRTKTQTYDPAGRALTSEEKASPATDTALPKVTNEYNTKTGALEKQSTTVESKTKTITSVDNTLGQLTSYTDADGNTTTYTYDIDGRVEEVNDGKGTQIYAYDATTGFLTDLLDSAAGTFTANYDVEGNMTSETYPNGMTATYTRNPLSQATGLEYVKTTHCSSGCTWFSDSITPSIHGETLSQTTTLAKDDYSYDNVGWLTQTQEEPAGKGCTTRLYAYDEESNRTSLTTREPGSEGKCATEGGTTEDHTYDSADRLTDEGIAYEAFGNTTKLPASDAGGHELTGSYYVDGQVATQDQEEKTIGYDYDPAGRTEETETIVKGKPESTTIDHYSGPGEALAWTSEGGEQWTRNIPGIDGELDAIQTSSGATTLQLHDLQGNIVATAALSETETKLLSTYNSTEFGVPSEGKAPPKYAWLGGGGVSTELASGVANAGGSSYVPEIGRPLQTEPIASPGSFPDGTASVGVVKAPYLGAASAQLMVLAAQEGAAREEAKRIEAEERAFMEEGFCEKYPDGSACHVDGPGEGNCEVNCLTVIGGGGGGGEVVLWESGASGCSGDNACASSLLGIKINLGDINQWWEQVKGGYRLIKETYLPGLEENFKENSTLCKAVGYGITGATYFAPEGKLAKLLGVAVGFGTTYGC